MKPRISVLRESVGLLRVAGSGAVRWWVCSDLMAQGVGSTPKAAYGSWLANRNARLFAGYCVKAYGWIEEKAE